MTPLLLQIVFCILGIMLQLVAMYYAGRPLVRALHRRKANELPRIEPPIRRVEEPKPAALRHELPQVRSTPKERVSAVVQERKEPAIRPGLLTKTEKVHFIH